MSLLSLKHFSFVPPESSLLLQGYYDPLLVAFSVLIAICAAYAALLVSQHIAATHLRSARRIWSTVGGVCLGLGIWAMHFVGMLAFSLPCSTSYDTQLTLLSTVPGIIASILAVNTISYKTLTPWQLGSGGLLMGAGVGTMHYTGMAAMGFNGLILYDAKLFTLSIVVAVALACLALWIKFRLQVAHSEKKFWVVLTSAIVLGLALSAMHYIAMLAAYFVRDDSQAVSSGIAPNFLAVIVLTVSALIILATIVATYLELATLISLKRSYKMVATLILGWISVAWLGADHYYQRLATDYYKQEISLARQEIEHVTHDLQQGLHVVQGIGAVVARDPAMQRSLARFGQDATPSGHTVAQRKASWTNDSRLAQTNRALATFAHDLNADAIWLMTTSGDCVAASNSEQHDSFIGANFAMRDYFRLARTGQRGQQYAMGSVSGKAGLYYSDPIFHAGRLVGVVAVKRNLEEVFDLIKLHHAFLVDANGAIILAGEKNWSDLALPATPVIQMPADKLLQQYRKKSFETLTVSAWEEVAHYPNTVLVGSSVTPRLLSTRSLPEHGLSIHIARPLEPLIRLKTDQSWLFFLLAASGSMLILATSAIVLHLRETKKMESEHRVSATAFESQQGMLITNAEFVILQVNKAFTDVTGYSATEAIGHTPKILQSGLHDSQFYGKLWDSVTRTGSWQGEIWSKRKNGDIYPEWLLISAVKDSNGLVTHYVGTLADITERKQSEDEINNLAFFDPLTNLPNRRLLMDRLQHAIAASTRSARHCALLFIDLDNFKALNDNRGHQVGDLLLQQVAQRLLSCVREGDTTARLGGDEFVVMLEDMSSNSQEAAEQTKTVGDKILLALNQPYQLTGLAHHSTPSIGVTLFAEHPGSVDDLLKRADMAMYEAKAAGRNTLRFFDPRMQAVVSARAALEDDLRQAIQHNQFLLYYQTQVNATGTTTGAEVLLRWKHPQRGMVSPADFIPLAEESGLILPLGHWVAETACTQLAIWAKNPALAHLTISVNVSARQFRQADFADEMLGLIAKTGANPQRLKLELTESLLVKDVEDIIRKMTALRVHGVGFSLDDFGTGYSSLSYLKRLPLDQLKIDQSFVRNILTDSNDAAIAKMVVALAQSMGLVVIAEGVELTEQRDCLLQLGCHHYQGYLYGKPVEVSAFEKSVTDSPITITIKSV